MLARLTLISAIILFPILLIGQKDSDTTVVKYNDVYDHFTSNSIPSDRSIAVRSKTTGDIIFQQKLEGKGCKDCYVKMTNAADSIFQQKNYLDASVLYLAAFRTNNDKGMVKHRFNLACAYVNLHEIDSAFTQLDRIVFVAKFYNVYQFQSQTCLEPLKKDGRWKKLLEGVQANLKAKEEQITLENPVIQD